MELEASNLKNEFEQMYIKSLIAFQRYFKQISAVMLQFIH